MPNEHPSRGVQQFVSPPLPENHRELARQSGGGGDLVAAPGDRAQALTLLAVEVVGTTPYPTGTFLGVITAGVTGTPATRQR